MMKRLLLIGLLLAPAPAFAQASFTFKDASATTQTVKSLNCSGTICQLFVPSDSTGTFLGTAPGTGNSSFALPIQGVSGGVAVPISGAVSQSGTWGVAQSGVWNITNISGTVSLPSGASTSANQTNASQKTQIVDGSGNVIGSTTNNLNVQCANCSGSGASGVDEGAFSAGSSVFGPIGGFYQTTATSNPLTNGQWGTWQLTANRAGMVNLRTAAGAEIGTAASPVQVSLANTASNGTAVLVTGTAGTFPATQSGTWTVNPTTIATWGLMSGTIPGTAPTNTLIAGGKYTSGGVTLTTTQTAPLQLDSSGNLLVNIQSGGGTGGTASNFAATFPASGTAIGLKNSGNMVAANADGSGYLLVNCATGCSGGPADESSFTAGSTSTFTGGFYQTTATSNPLTTGQLGVVQMTAQRAFFTNLRNSSGTEIGTSSNPVQVTLANTGANSTALLIGGAGTAGSAGGGVLTVQGVASMTPILSTLTGTNTVNVQGNSGGKLDQTTGSAVPGNALYIGLNGPSGNIRGWTAVNPSGSIYAGQVDLASIAGTTAVTAGVNGTLGVGGLAAGGAVPSGNPVYVAGWDGTDVRAISTTSTGAVNVGTTGDPCTFQAKSIGHFSSSTSGGSIITLASGKKAYICSISVVASAAANVSLIEGTGSSVCTGGTVAAVWGNTGTTAANGYPFAANGGLTIAGGGTVAQNATTSQNVCVLFNTTNSPQVVADVSYVQQ
jgi:hypothetical protein